MVFALGGCAWLRGAWDKAADGLADLTNRDKGVSAAQVEDKPDAAPVDSLADAGLADSERVAFKVQGKMVVMPTNEGAHKLSFVWRRVMRGAAADDKEGRGGALDIITVRSIAGIVLAKVRIDDSGAQLLTSARRTRADDAAALTSKVINVPVPLRLVGDFLGGGGDAQTRRRINDILGKRMRQLGWRAQIDTRDDAGLPLRFGAAGGEGSVDIVITRRQ